MAPKKSIGESYSLFFQNLFNFNGRTRRSDYWRVVIINSLVVGALGGIISGAFGTDSAVGSSLSSLLSIALFVLQLALVVRRLHDTGKKGTYYLLGLIPIVGWIIIFIALVTDSEPGDNAYGPNPKADPNAYQAYPNYQDPYAQQAYPQGGTYIPPTQDFNAAPVNPPYDPTGEHMAQPQQPVYNQAPPVQEPAPVQSEPNGYSVGSKCPACGADVAFGSNHCTNCGYALR